MIHAQLDAQSSAVAGEAMVVTSQPAATAVGVRVLKMGGTAVDAAVAAAAVLCAAEPMSTGLGADLFALIWADGRLHALDAAGPAPASAMAGAPAAHSGRSSVTVPGAVRGWGELLDRFGRYGLDALLRDAIEIAGTGVVPGPRTLHHWTRAEVPAEIAGPRESGGSCTVDGLEMTLRALARAGPDALYEGPLAEQIVGATWLNAEDLGSYRPVWVDPLRLEYRGVTLCAFPAPAQGVVALEALGLLEQGDPTLPRQVHAIRLALEDGFALVRDGSDVSGLLDPAHLALRAREVARAVSPPKGGTVHIGVVDSDGMAVSMMQSVFEDFGSGIVVSGIVLNNRAACFEIDGGVVPGARPYHTLVPAMLLDAERLLGPLGVVGGLMQAQGLTQVVSAIVDAGLDPQGALDRPRFRVDGAAVRLEPGLEAHADELARSGLAVQRSTDWWDFGGGNVILVDGRGLIAGSDSRKDGYAGGY